MDKILKCPFCERIQIYTIELVAKRNFQNVPVSWCDKCIDEYFKRKGEMERETITKLQAEWMKN